MQARVSTLQSHLQQAAQQAAERDRLLASAEGSRAMLEAEGAAARAEAKDKVGLGVGIPVCLSA